MYTRFDGSELFENKYSSTALRRENDIDARSLNSTTMCCISSSFR
jgi:hypothetical protein